MLVLSYNMGLIENEAKLLSVTMQECAIAFAALI